MAGPGQTPLLHGPSSANDTGVRQKVLVSHVITRLGTKGWLFVAPLVLVRFTPGSILGPALWGTATMLATAILAPALGKWADRTSRLVVITRGVILQFAAVVGATVVIVVSLSRPDGNREPDWASLLLYIVFGIIEKLGELLSDVSVKREWVPQLFNGEAARVLNSKMSQIDLTTEVVGPFIAGLIITWGSLHPDSLPALLDATDFGFVAVGALNALSFWPQLALLRSVYRSHADLLQPVPEDRLPARKGPVPPGGAWGAWCRHPGGVQLLSLSYAMLYLTVLSPHGALFTAFLQLREQPSWQLSIVRGSGALLGILGTVVRPAMGRQVGSRAADALSVCWLATWMAVALLSYEAACSSAPGNGSAPLGVTPPLLLFEAAVCLGRPGLYAFELGVLNQEQELVDQRHRSGIGAVDAALTSMGTLAMYGAGMYFSDSSQFGLLVRCSSFFVSCGACTYLVWTALYKSVKHRHAEEEHGHGHEHGHTHGHDTESHAHHEHTLQMAEMKETLDDGSYMHEHIIYEPANCIVQ
mmetsp:Transcript_79367/g.233177  ORF Transcript_79367/g.233177 Transcript_79367/m.233177 type:complete len:529 (+) Transcript_79367:64-1650(+)